MKYIEFNKRLVNLEKVERIFVRTYGQPRIVIHFNSYGPEGLDDFTEKEYPSVEEAEKAYNRLRRIIAKYQGCKRLPKF